jgi:hypothetical protein
MKHKKLHPVGVRFDEVERRALKQTARADDRSLSAMIRKIVTEYLVTHGALK